MSSTELELVVVSTGALPRVECAQQRHMVRVRVARQPPLHIHRAPEPATGAGAGLALGLALLIQLLRVLLAFLVLELLLVLVFLLLLVLLLVSRARRRPVEDCAHVVFEFMYSRGRAE